MGSEFDLALENLPLLGPERDAGLLRCRVTDRQFDLDALPAAADLEFDMAGAGDAAAGRDGSGDAAAAAVEQFHVVGPEIERGLAVRRILSGKAEGSVIDPQLSVGHRHRQRARTRR